MIDGFCCNRRHFIVPSYKVYIDFGRCDGIVEIIWHENLTSLLLHDQIQQKDSLVLEHLHK